MSWGVSRLIRVSQALHRVRGVSDPTLLGLAAIVLVLLGAFWNTSHAWAGLGLLAGVSLSGSV